MDFASLKFLQNSYISTYVKSLDVHITNHKKETQKIINISKIKYLYEQFNLSLSREIF